MKDRIKAVRKDDAINGKTQQLFADFLGIPLSNLASYESGRRIPSAAVVNLIANKCGINETWLLDGSGNMHDPPSDEQMIASVVTTLQVKSEPVKAAMITGISKANESTLKEVLGLILEELKKNGVDMNFED